MLSSNRMKLVQVPSKARPRRGLRSLLFWGVAALVLALDQATKELVRANLERGEFWPNQDWAVRVHYVTNTGAAFGILQDQTGFLIVTALLGLAAILLYYGNLPIRHTIGPIAIGMMLGGAAGNLADRLRLGHVTDFIDFPMWPAFNVADASITLAVITLLAAYALGQLAASVLSHLAAYTFGQRKGQGTEAPHEDPSPDGR